MAAVAGLLQIIMKIILYVLIKIEAKQVNLLKNNKLKGKKH